MKFDLFLKLPLLIGGSIFTLGSIYRYLLLTRKVGYYSDH